MHSVQFKKILYLSIFLAILSISVFQVNALSYPVNNEKVLQQSTPTNSILTIEKRVNNTIVQVNDTIIVELILTNIGNNPIYNITLTENSINNPEIITRNLFSPMKFAKFEPNEQRVISYTITSLKVTNITLSKSIATYQQENVANAPIFTSYSQAVTIQVLSKTLSQTDVNLNNLLILSVIAIFYTVILVIRTLFNLTKRSKS